MVGYMTLPLNKSSTVPGNRHPPAIGQGHRVKTTEVVGVIISSITTRLINNTALYRYHSCSFLRFDSIPNDDLQFFTPINQRHHQQQQRDEINQQQQQQLLAPSSVDKMAVSDR